jgi:hypothetical protein
MYTADSYDTLTNTGICMLEAKIGEPEEMAVTREWLSKHASTANQTM